MDNEALHAKISTLEADIKKIKASYESFVYNVSHDFSAPLRQIEGFSSFIAKKYYDSFDETSQKHFDFIRSGAREATNMLISLSEVARTITLDHPYAMVDINDIVEDISLQYKKLITQKNATICYDTLPSLYAKNELIHTLFDKVIHNALIYSQPDIAPIINITVSEQQNHYAFTISDNGIGLDPNYHNKVFGMFQRGYHANHDITHDGGGVGLSVAKHIIEAEGGDISMESDCNSGMRLHFTIPKKDH